MFHVNLPGCTCDEGSIIHINIGPGDFRAVHPGKKYQVLNVQFLGPVMSKIPLKRLTRSTKKVSFEISQEFFRQSSKLCMLGAPPRPTMPVEFVKV